MRVTNFGLAATMLVSVVLLGGGNANFPMQRMFVELVGIIVLAIMMWRGFRGPRDTWSTALILFAAGMFALGLVQIVPLPPSVWHALSNRTLPAAIEGLVGAWDHAMPLSLTPDATIRSILFLFPVLAMLLATLACDQRDRRRLLNLTVCLALLSALLGVFQVAAGPGGPYVYAIASQDPAVGVFSNHNHQADLLLIAMLLAATMRTPRQFGETSWQLVRVGILAFLSVTVIATMSRAGVVLLVPVLIVSIALMLPPSILRDRRLWMASAAGLIVLGGVGALLSRNAMVIRTMARFHADTDPRFMFWPTVVQATKDYFPVGSGLGSFVPVFKAVEPLEIINRAYVVHAHNDYLELTLETGLAGVLLILLFSLLYATGVWRAFRDPARHVLPAQVIAIATAIAILLIHSFGDYPLRTIALASVLAMLMANLSPALPVSRRKQH